MFKLNKKGQASSTFQLLIAAIVALAILGVLISVIGGIGGISGDPTTATKQLLKNQINNPGAESCTDPVEFSAKKNKSLAASGITKDSGLDVEQVVFTAFDDDDKMHISGFTTQGDGALLQYNSQSSRKVVVCIICDEAHRLNDAIGDNLGDSYADLIEDDPENYETKCIVYPKKTS